MADTTTSHGGLRFRIATPEDAPQLQPLVKSAYRDRGGWTTEADLLRDDRIDVDGVLNKIATPDTVVLFITSDAGALVACCELAKRSADLAYLGMFAVDPRRQGGGIGNRILAYAGDYCRRTWGAKRIEISVTWPRPELSRWYSRRGFRETGETRPFPYNELAEGEALRDDLYFVIMEKELAAA
ncbi:putative acetyltransferase [Hypoxylon sp. FL1150]|nr:putative acetyltransferase [Hypoxylon sp. FL1150]